MKILNPKQVELFLNILDKKPGQQIIHFSESSHLLTKKLQRFCQENNIHYNLYCTKDVFYDKSKTKYANTSHIDIFKFDLHSFNYISQGTKYDYLIVTLDFTKVCKRQFLERSCPILRQGGSLIIITPQSDNTGLHEWQSILHDEPYETVNTFNTILDDYDVILAKYQDR